MNGVGSSACISFASEFSPSTLPGFGRSALRGGMVEAEAEAEADAEAEAEVELRLFKPGSEKPKIWLFPLRGCDAGAELSSALALGFLVEWERPMRLKTDIVFEACC